MGVIKTMIYKLFLKKYFDRLTSRLILHIVAVARMEKIKPSDLMKEISNETENSKYITEMLKSFIK